MGSYKAEFMKLSKVELVEKLVFATEVMCDNCPYLWVENGSSHNKRVTARKPRPKSPKKATS